MTDNEKRAHDLAVAMSIEICHLKMAEQVSNKAPDENNVKTIELDFFDEYMNAYGIALEGFNKRFPDGK